MIDIDISKNRSDLREFVYSAIQSNADASNLFTDNVKLMQVHLTKRKDSQNMSVLSDAILESWIREVMKDPRYVIKGIDESTLISMYMGAYKGYGPLQHLITDKKWSDVKLISYNQIWTKGKNGWMKQPISFYSQDEADKFVQGIFNKHKSSLNVKFPYNNCIDYEYRLRINGSIGDINPLGAFMVARKQSHYQLSDEKIINSGTANEAIQALMEVNMHINNSFYVYGEQNSGKTTYLANMLDKIPEYIALTTLEDTPEFSLKKENWHSHLTRPHVGEGYDPIFLDKLAYNFLRESGEWLCIGEVRSDETFDMLAATSGGNPACGSVHARTAEMAWERLLFLSLKKSGMSESTLKAYFKLYFKMLIGMASEGERKVVNEVSIENDDRTGMVDVWKRTPGAEDWEFQVIPNWYINQARSCPNPIPQSLLRKARII